MKTYTRKAKTSKELKVAIENVLRLHEKYRSSYFWSASRYNAGQRRREESIFAKNNPDFDIVTANGTIEVRPELSISCKNVYYKLNIWLNGEKKNVSILKKFL